MKGVSISQVVSFYLFFSIGSAMDDAALIAFMCDAYRQSKYSSSDNYSLVEIMRDVLKVVKTEERSRLAYLESRMAEIELIAKRCNEKSVTG